MDKVPSPGPGDAPARRSVVVAAIIVVALVFVAGIAIYSVSRRIHTKIPHTDVVYQHNGKTKKIAP